MYGNCAWTYQFKGHEWWFSKALFNWRGMYTLFHMHPIKAMGPDGLRPIFLKKYWHIVGSLVTLTTLDSLNNGVVSPTPN